MYLFNNYLLNTYYLPGTILGPEDLRVNKIEKFLPSQNFYFSGDDRWIVNRNIT